MKRQLAAMIRRLARVLPLSMAHKQRLRDGLFRRFPVIFKHLPSYRMWHLQHPDLVDAVMQKRDLTAERAAYLAANPISQTPPPAMLMISHGLGGGTEYHLAQIVQRLQEESGMAVWQLRSEAQRWGILSPWGQAFDTGLMYHLRDDQAAFTEQLRAFNIQHIHVHHLMDFTPEMQRIIPEIATDMGIEYDFTAHDYLAICPRFTLYDEAVKGYCGEPDVGRCSGCVKQFGSVAGDSVDVSAWRRDYDAFLAKARRVFVPDSDVQRRLERYLPNAKITLRPHFEHFTLPPCGGVGVTSSSEDLTPSQKGRGNAPLRIVILGAIAPHKGSQVLHDCARDAKQRGLPLEFTLIGYSDIDWQLKRYMKVTGPYETGEISQLLTAGDYDIAFFPAVLPETYSYTLSEVLRHGMFPVSFDIGAIASRIRKLGFGAVLPYADYCHPQRINDALLALRPAPANAAAIAASFAQYSSLLGDYYEWEPR